MNGKDNPSAPSQLESARPIELKSFSLAASDWLRDAPSGEAEPVGVLVDGQEVKPDPENGWVYDELMHSVRFQGAARKQAFTAKIDITCEEHR